MTSLKKKHEKTGLKLAFDHTIAGDAQAPFIKHWCLPNGNELSGRPLLPVITSGGKGAVGSDVKGDAEGLWLGA